MMTFDDETVRVDPDVLLRVGSALNELAGQVSREVPTAQGLVSSPPGWTMRAALAHLNHSVRRHLLILSEELTECGDGLRSAALDYRETDRATGDRLRQVEQAL